MSAGPEPGAAAPQSSSRPLAAAAQGGCALARQLRPGSGARGCTRRPRAGGLQELGGAEAAGRRVHAAGS